jgi:hypothetical protein
MKTIGNQGFLTTSDAMGRSVPVKAPVAFQIANKINCFVAYFLWDGSDLE